LVSTYFNCRALSLIFRFAVKAFGARSKMSSSTSADKSSQSMQPSADSLGRLRQAVPTVLVGISLLAVAAWGHHTDWTMPKFSALVGAEPTAAAAWCVEHSLPEAECIECNPSLTPPGHDYGWCKQHGVAQCPLHHPDVAQLKSPPVVTAADLERAERALALQPRAENNQLCKSHQRRIQFASIAAVEKAGIDIAVVHRRPIVEAITANGELIYDQTRQAHLASRVTGSVWKVQKQVGDSVRQGDILAIIDAAEIGRAKGEFLQAIAQQRLKQTTADRMKSLVKDASVSDRTYREAEAGRQEAQIRLLCAQQALVNLGLPVRAEEFTEMDPAQIAERIQFLGLPAQLFASSNIQAASSNLFPLRSPLDGLVVDCHVVPGEVVDTTSTLFGIADVRRLWLTLAVRQSEARYIAVGQKVLFRSSESGGESGGEAEIEGSVGWISTAADDRTRTVKVRVEFFNPDGKLRANTFGVGRVVLRQEAQATVVPNEAVHSDGDCNVVFVRDKDFLRERAPKFFHVREVRVGVKSGDVSEIIVGLLPGEVIASKNSVVLEAQLLKSGLGAGCGCAEGH